MRLRVLPVALLGCGIALAQAAHADAASEAKRLFEEGRKALAEGKVGPACESFAEAKRLAPEACGVVQNLATCRQQQGRYLDATAEFDALTACATKAGQPDRVKFADEQRASMRSKLGFLTLVVGNGPALTKLYVDAAAIDLKGFDGKPRAFEPGPHRLEIERQGCAPERLEVTLVAGVAQSLVLPATCGTPPSTAPTTDPAPAASTAATPAPFERPAPPVQSARWQIPVGWGAVALGAVGIIGAFAPCGLIAAGHKKNNEDDQARSTATICTVVGVAGAVVLGAGVVVLLTAPSKKSSPTLSFMPRFAGPKEAGVSATLRF
jgi:hypothetical protein